MANMQDTLTANVIRLARAKGIRPTDLARAMSQNRSIGTMILSGKRKVPLHHVLSIAQLLDVSMADLLGEHMRDLIGHTDRDTNAPLPKKAGGNDAPQETPESTIILQQLLAEQIQRNDTLEGRVHALEEVIQSIGAALIRRPADHEDPPAQENKPKRRRRH